AGARAVLACAGRLAARRVVDTRRAAAALAAIHRPPWSGPEHPPPPCPRGLTPTDLLRALLVEETPLIAGCLRGGSGPAFVAAVARWSELAAAACDGSPPRGLEPPWGLHLTLEGRLRADALTVDALACMLDDASFAALGELSADYDGGLVTRGEAEVAAWEGLHAASALVGDRWSVAYAATPPVYLDRHDGLAQLDAALSAHLGVMIVGAPGSGRTRLLEAWALRSRFGDGDRLAGTRLRLNPFVALEGWLGGDVEAWEAAAGEGKPWILGFSPARSEWWRLGEDGEWPGATRAIEHFGGFARSGASVRVVVVVTEEERATLEARAPITRQFARVDVPPLSLVDAPALWLCNRLDAPPLSVERALTALWLRSDEPLARVLAEPRASDEPTAREPGWVRRALVRRGRLDARGRELLRRFELTDDRLSALSALASRLRAMIGEDGSASSAPTRSS
ncbi:MAG: hypothetical protein KC636_17270, partial [Myxococcales bacterium]|nr:hypothetical protein [Myxococcales bacterium]